MYFNKGISLFPFPYYQNNRLGLLKELYADSVQFSYTGDRPLLTGGYLKCHIGDVIGLLGRNGCGKSTLLKILFGSLRAKHSYIRINGERTGKAYLTGKVGYLPQDSFLPTHEKVSSLIGLMVEDPVLRALLSEDVRIQAIRDKRVYQLSGGELRYLEICLLMYQPTDFLLLDEPFTGLEPIYVQYITELILRFKDKKGFVISDHHYRHVLDVATEISLLQHGSCRRIHHPKELEFFYLPDGALGD